VRGCWSTKPSRRSADSSLVELGGRVRPSSFLAETPPLTPTRGSCPRSRNGMLAWPATSFLGRFARGRIYALSALSFVSPRSCAASAPLLGMRRHHHSGPPLNCTYTGSSRGYLPWTRCWGGSDRQRLGVNAEEHLLQASLQTRPRAQHFAANVATIEPRSSSGRLRWTSATGRFAGR
jgi:hypothetical protein